MAAKIISSWISSGSDDKNLDRRLGSHNSNQQQQPQQPQHKNLTKLNSACETYMGSSDKQLYCDKNIQQIQSLSPLRQSYSPYMCHNCLRGPPPRPVSLVAGGVQENSSYVSRPSSGHDHVIKRPSVKTSVKRSVSYHQGQRGSLARQSGTVSTQAAQWLQSMIINYEPL